MANSGIVNTMLAAAQVFQQQQQMAQQFALQKEALMQRAAEQDEINKIREEKNRLADQALDQKALLIQQGQEKIAETERHNKAIEADKEKGRALQAESLHADVELKTATKALQLARTEAAKASATANEKRAVLEAEGRVEKAQIERAKLAQRAYEFDQTYGLKERSIASTEARNAAYVGLTGQKTEAIQSKSRRDQAMAASMKMPLPEDLKDYSQFNERQLEKAIEQQRQAINKPLSDVLVLTGKAGTSADPRVAAQDELNRLTRTLTIRRESAGAIYDETTPTQDKVLDAMYQGTASTYDDHGPTASVSSLNAFVGGLNDGSLTAQLTGASPEDKQALVEKIAIDLANIRTLPANDQKVIADRVLASIKNYAPELEGPISLGFKNLINRP